jgi:hypothetical protein
MTDMSYTLTPYAIDLEQLRRAIGSKDEALLAQLREEYPEDRDDEDPDEEGITRDRALSDLIMGTPRDEEAGYQYGYAMDCLCEHFGERLEAAYWESITWRVLQGTGMGDLLHNSGSPVPLPKIDDFPMIGHLPADRVKELASRLGDTPPKTVDLTGKKKRRTLGQWAVDKVLERITRRPMPGDDDLVECMEEYAGWLREAAGKGKAIVFFYH